MVELSTRPQNQAQVYAEFVALLQAEGFSGELENNDVELLLASFDNSVYQVKPYVIAFPKSKHDLLILLRCANQQRFSSIDFSVRGGGTSTIGQSLHSGCILDLHKYFNQVIRLDIKEKQVTVLSGMVLERLNNHLKSVGMQFPVTISSGCAATIGGMVNTDAAGVGSYCLGRMHDHVIAIRGMLIDGSEFYVTKTSLHAINSQHAIGNIPTEYYRRICAMVNAKKKKIFQLFTKTGRTLTGYNINDFFIDQGFCSLIPILCGSEGTLAVITEITLAIEKIKLHNKLIVIGYKDFIDSVTNVDEMLLVKPNGIEAMDGNLLNAARNNSIIYSVVEKYFLDSHKLLQGLTLVEFSGEDLDEIDQRIKEFRAILSYRNDNNENYLVEDKDDIKRFWDVRKKSVGLMGSMTKKGRRPIPFIEDSAVPLINLKPYIIDMQNLLHKYDLIYGIYGHLDSGCLHVRPALDLSQHLDQDLFKKIMNEVLCLIEKYAGNFRAEHGYGFLSQFNKVILGDDLFLIMCKIKSIFDPSNRLNPGKIAVVDQESNDLLDFQSHWYATKYTAITRQDQDFFDATIACNGNAACLNQSEQSLICPSYHATHDMKFSPRGRAIMFREWLVEKNNKNKDIFYRYIPGVNIVVKMVSLYKLKKKNDLEWQLYTSMQGCLSCKACVSQCPVKVSIPKARDEYIHYFRSRYRISNHFNLYSYIEWLTYFLACMPFWFKRIMNRKLITSFFKMILGLTEIPVLSQLSLRRSMRQYGISYAKPSILVDDHAANIVIIVLDMFTAFYHTDIVIDCMKLFKKMGISCYIMPFLPSGKSAKIVGDLRLFKKHAQRFVRELLLLYAINPTIHFVCIEPSIALFFRSDYKEYEIGNGCAVNILLPQELLFNHFNAATTCGSKIKSTNTYYLLSHCHEKSLLAEGDDLWLKVFKLNGLQLNALNTGCCGMAGFYGLKKNNIKYSKFLYDRSYRNIISNNEIVDHLVVTGFSCREQIQRFSNKKVYHPLQVLCKHLVST